MSTLTLTHIGGPTTLIEADGWRILTDPTFDPPGRRYRFGWGTASVKTVGPAIAPADLGPIDAVLLTHDHHADNLDVSGRRLLPSADVVLTTTSGAQRLGGNAHGLPHWATTRLERPDRPTIEVTATPCRHGPVGSHRIVGDVVGFALTWAGQEHGAVWISGDTVVYGGVREVATRVDVGTAIVHVGRVRFALTGPLTYTMGIRGAMELCRLVDPSTIIPVHYDGWSHFTEGRDDIDRELARRPRGLADRVRWTTPGQPLQVVV